MLIKGLYTCGLALEVFAAYQAAVRLAALFLAQTLSFCELVLHSKPFSLPRSALQLERAKTSVSELGMFILRC